MLANAKPLSLAKVQLPGRLSTDENGNPVYVHMRPLPQEEILQAKAAALRDVSKMYGSDPWIVASEDGREMATSQMYVHILASAMRDGEQAYSDPFATADDISKEFLPSEIAWLFEQWSVCQNTHEVFMSVPDIVKEVEELVQQWGKGRRSKLSSRRYVTDTAHSIIFELVDRVSRQAQMISSASTSEKPSGESTSGQSDDL